MFIIIDEIYIQIDGCFIQIDELLCSNAASSAGDAAVPRGTRAAGQ